MVTLFYAYGATVHLLNMLGLAGFDWSDAPVKWQVLDVAYLLTDLVVVVGLVRRWRISIAAFYLAATSQIILYTASRGWFLDVPEPYAGMSAQPWYLNALVVFSLLTLAVVTRAIRSTNIRAARG